MRVGPGIRLNINKRSLGFSFGVPGMRFSMNSSGRRTRSLGIPGTGLYYVSSMSSKAGKRKDAPPQAAGMPLGIPNAVLEAPAQPPTPPLDDLVPSAPPGSPDAEHRFRQGFIAYLTEDWSNAALLFQEAVAGDASNTSDQFLLALSFVELGRHREAAELFEQVFDDKTTLPDSFMRRYVPKSFRLVVAITPRVAIHTKLDSLSAALMLIESYQRAGRLKDAIAAAHLLRELVPRDAVIRLALADLLFDTGEYEAVVAATDDANGTDDVHLATIQLRALSMAQLDRRQDGARQLAAAITRTKTTDKELLEAVHRDYVELTAEQPSTDSAVVARKETTAGLPPDSSRRAPVGKSSSAPMPHKSRKPPANLPTDRVTGCLLPAADYSVSLPWRRGDTVLHLDVAASWLRAPLAAGIAFIDVDLLGIHRVAEAISGGYGNAVVSEVCNRLMDCTRGDPVFRIGSDSFLLCIRPGAYEPLSKKLDEIRTAILRPVPFPEASTELGLTCTIGAAISRGGEDSEIMLERSLRAASLAMQSGRSQHIERA